MNRKTMIWAALALVALVTVTYAAGSMTITGSVVSTTADQLVVRAADGEKTFVVNDSTMKPADLAIGAKVNVTYHDMNGQMVASQVSAVQPSVASTATTSSSTTSTSGAYAPPAAPAAGTTEPAETASTATEPAYAPQAQSSDPAAQESQESTVAAAETDDDLPATASRLPLLALLGLGAGAGALVLRRVH